MTSDELLAKLDAAIARICKLEAELAFYKGFHDGVCKDGTHLVVPVEPTTLMIHAGVENHERGAVECYRAMIRAAQPDKPKQGE